MYLMNEDGIHEVPKRKKFLGLFCSHEKSISGLSCSKSGMQRISGNDYYRYCKKCGKLLDERHTQW